MTNSFQENRSRIIFVFVITFLIGSVAAVHAQTDSLKAIKLPHQSFANLREPKTSLYLPYATSYNLQQGSYVETKPYSHLYTAPKQTIGSTIFNVIGVGVLSVFGDNNGRTYQAQTGQWQKL